MKAIVAPLSRAPERHTPAAVMMALCLLAHIQFGLALAFTASRMLGGVA